MSREKNVNSFHISDRVDYDFTMKLIRLLSFPFLMFLNYPIFGQINLIGETHMDAFSYKLNDQEFKVYWDSLINEKNSLIDSILHSNPNAVIMWEAPVSFEFYINQYLISGEWNDMFLPDKIYDKAWIEHLRRKYGTRFNIRTIDIDKKSLATYTSGALIGSLLKDSKNYEWLNKPKPYLDSLIAEVDSIPLKQALTSLSTIHFEKKRKQSKCLYKFFQKDPFLQELLANNSEDVDLDYMQRLKESYTLGYKLPSLSEKRLAYRDQHFFEQLNQIPNERIFICGKSHVSENKFIENNVYQLLLEANMSISVYLIE